MNNEKAIIALAKKMADDVIASLNRLGGSTISVSVWNYGISKREMPKFLECLRADGRFDYINSLGIMGYIEFRTVGKTVTHE